MGDFYRLVPFPPTRGPLSGTHETRRWASYRPVADTEHLVAINHVEFSARTPHEIAVSASSRVVLLDAYTAQIRRVLSRGIKSTAYSGSFRKDGLLLVTGSEDSVVSVFRLQDWALTRKLKGHQGAVHTSLFSSDGLRIMTGSDDKTVKMWDLATSRCLMTLTQAQDYVRCQAASPASSHLWAAGSYDRRARVYDLRSKKCIFALDHGSQVDGLVLLPGGARAVTAGGPDVKIWDFFSGGQVVNTVRNHAKGVTCAKITNSGDRVLTGGLDGQIKVHDAGSFDVVASMSFKSQVLSFDLSPDEKRLAVGTSKGTVSVRAQHGFQKDLPQPDPSGGLKEKVMSGVGRGRVEESNEPRVGSLRYYLRGADVGPTDDRDLLVKQRKRPRLRKHDKLLQKFEYTKALDATIEDCALPLVISVIEELMARDAIRTALGGRSYQRLVPIIRIVSDNITNPKYTFVLTTVAEQILDLYSNVLGHSDDFDRLFIELKSNILHEIRDQRNLLKLSGSVDLLMSVMTSV